MRPTGPVRQHLRWLLMAAAIIGLFAMHGLTATSASAMSGCGQVPHALVAAEHTMAASAHTAADQTSTAAPHDEAPAAEATLAVTSMGISMPSDASHAAMSCLAILLVGFLAFLVARRAGIRIAPAYAFTVRSGSRSGGRAPPGPEQAELSVWRN